MKKVLLIVFFCTIALNIFPQNQKFALVIGNGTYTNLSKLTNPINDANDIAATLQGLGFTVDKILNGSLDQMDKGIMKLKNRLSVSSDSYGFFFYAGHGVQSGGENYLIPVDANIPGENFLKTRALSVQAMLDELNDAGNKLNVVVLDACRDNPFGWGRSGTRGLTMVSKQPADSIIVYATSAGQQASDGSGRNGMFTSQLLSNLKNQSLDVGEVFRRTGLDVANVSKRQQIPAIYNQFFEVAYLGTKPAPEPAQVASAKPAPMPLPDKPSSTPKEPPKAPIEKEPKAPVEKDPKEPPKEGPEKTASPGAEASRLWSIGASLGTCLADPFFIATLRGTIAPFNYSFFEFGLDLGLISKYDIVKKYSSMHPYVHFAYFKPVSEKMNFYAGGGASLLIASYAFARGDTTEYIPAADIIAGINLFNMLDISYTLQTNFKTAGNRISLGYFYRFK